MYERTPEIRKKISDALKKAHKNHKGAWRKDYSASESFKKKISERFLGKKLSEEHIKKRTEAQRGLKRGEETRLKMSEARRGEKCRFWKGGVSKHNRTERKNFMSTFEYREWRRSVFTRDNYTCVKCGQRGGVLHADHIKPFSLYPEERLSIENGRTMCIDCHKKTDTWGFKIALFKEKISV